MRRRERRKEGGGFTQKNVSTNEWMDTHTYASLRKWAWLTAASMIASPCAQTRNERENGKKWKEKYTVQKRIAKGEWKINKLWFQKSGKICVKNKCKFFIQENYPPKILISFFRHFVFKNGGVTCSNKTELRSTPKGFWWSQVRRVKALFIKTVHQNYRIFKNQ